MLTLVFNEILDQGDFPKSISLCQVATICSASFLFGIEGALLRVQHVTTITKLIETKRTVKGIWKQDEHCSVWQFQHQKVLKDRLGGKMQLSVWA